MSVAQCRSIPFQVVFWLAAGFLFGVEQTGVVRDPLGKPVERAWVNFIDAGVAVYSDSQGRFRLKGIELPAEIEVVHPSFETLQVVVQAPSDWPVEIVLEPKRPLNETITVTARMPSGGFSPAGAAATMIHPENTSQPASTLTDLVQNVPGVSESGQGGIFQVYSIRGISRQRVLTTISGMRITSERRAGVSASFLDPALVEAADILRGPASSYHGSGALGGVVQVVPRRFTSSFFESGYDSRGDERFILSGWGQKGWSLGFAWRDAGNYETPDGTSVNSHFTQYSTVISKDWDTASGSRYQFLLIPTVTRDIGKANTNFPVETTNYPEEKHLLARFSFSSINNWELSAYIHPHDLHTRDIEPETENNVFNDTVDFGTTFRRRFQLTSASQLNFGVDYFGRRDVDAVERRQSRRDNRPIGGELRTLSNAREDEVGLSASLKFEGARFALEGGGRFSYFRQENAELEPIDTTAWNGFFGGVFRLGAGFELNGSIGSGLRFPSLTERFFSGTTGRGEVFGNPGLESERSLNVEGGVKWFGTGVFLAIYGFRNEIDDYVERIEFSPDLLTFLNLTEGTISGLEFEAGLEPFPGWQIFWRGHLIDGESGPGEPLGDIPVSRSTLGFRHRVERWSYGGEWQYRDNKTDPGSGEKVIPAAHLMSASASFDLNPSWTVLVAAENLLDEEYFNSADNRVPLSAGRSLSVRLRWVPDW